MQIYRTPEERFEVWVDFPFKSNYIEIDGLRMHYVDEGDPDAPVMLMVHGMPTSCYLYRHLIKRFVAAGYRCVVPDHIGFGKSDKVTDDAWYSIEKHQQFLAKFVVALDLTGITVMVQDWGGPLGLRGAVDMPERYERLCILNTWLHHADFYYPVMMWAWNRVWHEYDIPGPRITDPILSRRIASWFAEKFIRFMVGKHPIGSIVYTVIRSRRGVNKRDEPEYVTAEAPFTTFESRAGVRRFPLSLTMYNPTGGNAADQERCYNALKQWTKPAHFIWGDGDPNFTIEKMNAWAAVVPGSTTHVIPGAGHFTQETHHREIGDTLLKRIGEEQSS